MLKGKELGAAIKRAMELKIASGKAESKAEIARHFNVKPPSVHDWINKGAISKDKLPELWRYFSDVVDMNHWGISDMTAMAVASASLHGTLSNVEEGPDIRGRVPLISWVQAGAFCQSVDLFEPGDAERWLLTTQNLGPHAYALRVKGDSMVNPIPGGHSYPEGVIIFIDPDTVVTNGCRVIARIPDADEATFKVYSEDAGKKWLKPLNPQYPMIEMTDEMMICGVVRAVLREE